MARDREPLNFYGLPITPPEYFDGAHEANPMGAGLPPVCSCGWTRHEAADGTWFEMSDHLADMQGGAPRRVGYVDALGYLRCATCAPQQTADSDRPVYSDSAPHAAEPCDACSAVVKST